MVQGKTMVAIVVVVSMLVFGIELVANEPEELYPNHTLTIHETPQDSSRGEVLDDTKPDTYTYRHNQPNTAENERDFFGFSSRECSSYINNYTNFCPEDMMEPVLSAIRNEYPSLFRIPRKDVYNALSGKIIIVAGDSLSVQAYISLCCTYSYNQTDIMEQLGPTWKWKGTRMKKKPLRCAAVANTTICYYHGGTKWSDPWMSDVMAATKRFLHQNDILIINSGIHFTPDAPDGGGFKEYKKRLEAIVREYECEEKQPQYSLLWREPSAQHFKTTRGGWWPGRHVLRPNSDGAYNCYPQLKTAGDMISEGYLPTVEAASPTLLNEAANSVLKAHNIDVIQGWNASYTHWKAHSGYLRLDCTHFCLPGVPDTWSLRVYEKILKLPKPDLMPSRNGNMNSNEELESLLLPASGATPYARERIATIEGYHVILDSFSKLRDEKSHQIWRECGAINRYWHVFESEPSLKQEMVEILQKDDWKEKQKIDKIATLFQDASAKQG